MNVDNSVKLFSKKEEEVFAWGLRVDKYNLLLCVCVDVAVRHPANNQHLLLNCHCSSLCYKCQYLSFMHNNVPATIWMTSSSYLICFKDYKLFLSLDMSVSCLKPFPINHSFTSPHELVSLLLPKVILGKRFFSFQNRPNHPTCENPRVVSQQQPAM